MKSNKGGTLTDCFTFYQEMHTGTVFFIPWYYMRNNMLFGVTGF